MKDEIIKTDHSVSVNEERLKLLIQKYVKKLSGEENARLEILCEKVRQLFPRVTMEDFERIETLGNKLSELNKLDKKLSGKYFIRNVS